MSKYLSKIPISGKISFPALEKIFLREQLFEQLHLSQNKFITWISSPPGSGKTTLVSSYITSCKKPYIWIRCDKTDNDIVSFINYMSLAADHIQRGLGKTLPTLEKGFSGNHENFLRNYFRILLEGLKKPSVVVLDDIHEISSDSVLIRTLPSIADEFNGHHALIIISREQILDSLIRIKLNQQITEIQWDALQLSEEETYKIAALYGVKQSLASVKSLHQLCGGWVAPLRLLLLSNLTEKSINKISHENIESTRLFGYLAAEVFDKISLCQRNALMLLSLSPVIIKELLSLVATEECDVKQIENLLDQQLIQVFPAKISYYKFHPLYKEFLEKQAALEIEEKYRFEIVSSFADVLLDSGFTLEAADLYMDLKYFDKLAEIILINGEWMSNHSLYLELERWSVALPEYYSEQQPWLRYWYAVSILTKDQNKSRIEFERSHEKFLQYQDVKGVYLSWIGALEACIYSFENFLFIEGWLEKLEHVRELFPKYPSLEIRMRVLGCCMFSYFIGYPKRKGMKSVFKAGFRLVNYIPISSLRVLVGSQVSWCLYINGNSTKFKRVVELIRPHLNNSKISSFYRLSAYVVIAMHDWTNFLQSSRENVKEGLELAEETGVHNFSVYLKGQALLSLLSEGKLQDAREMHDQFFKGNPPTRILDVASYSCVCAIHEAMSGNIHLAHDYIRESVESFSQIGFRMSHATSLCLYAEILSEMKAYDQAIECLKQAEVVAEKTDSNLIRLYTLFSHAVIDLNMKNYDSLSNKVKKAFNLGSSLQVYAANGLRRDNLHKLCVFAYANNIELDYANKLVEFYRFSYPEQQGIIEEWPWRLKISVFGAFRVQLNGLNSIAETKAQKKPFELLQVIAAMGGKSISIWRVAEVLSPESEGDSAYHAIETTVYRLRKIFGKEVVEVKDNKVSLSKQHCWTDMWQLDEVFYRINLAVESRVDVYELMSLINKMLRLYCGPILSELDEPWLGSIRDKSRSTFLNVVKKLLTHFETASKYQQSIELLDQVLLREPYQEDFYLQLMVCYQKLGQESKAIDVFRQCEHTFYHNNEMTLSKKIKVFADSLY